MTHCIMLNVNIKKWEDVETIWNNMGSCMNTLRKLTKEYWSQDGTPYATAQKMKKEGIRKHDMDYDNAGNKIGIHKDSARNAAVFAKDHMYDFGKSARAL